MIQPEQQGIYRSNARLDAAPYIPDGVRSVLEVGCGRGGFGPTLRRRLGQSARLTAIEAVPDQADMARAVGAYDEVITGYFPADLPDDSGPFDLVCFNDVLEHLVDPWGDLKALRRWLAPDGQVLATIPSIQFAPVVWDLVRGRWEYRDEGTLDRTHLRFFTRASMIRLFEDAGYEVVLCRGVNSLAEGWRRHPSPIRRAAARVLARFLGNAQFVHFVVLGRPAGDGKPMGSTGEGESRLEGGHARFVTPESAS